MTDNARRQKILIVEDDPAELEALSSALSSEGFDIVTAFDGASGLEKAHNTNPDLILLDIRMPASSGFDMLRRLRASGSFGAQVPVIFLTNIAPQSDDELADIQSLHPSGYIIKSETDMPEILKKIRLSLSAA